MQSGASDGNLEFKPIWRMDKNNKSGIECNLAHGVNLESTPLPTFAENKGKHLQMEGFWDLGDSEGIWRSFCAEY